MEMRLRFDKGESVPGGSSNDRSKAAARVRREFTEAAFASDNTPRIRVLGVSFATRSDAGESTLFAVRPARTRVLGCVAAGLEVALGVFATRALPAPLAFKGSAAAFSLCRRGDRRTADGGSRNTRRTRVLGVSFSIPS
eukprot:Opistho-2@74922